jgi:hypothetical protein
MLNALFLFSKIFGQRKLTKLKTSLALNRPVMIVTDDQRNAEFVGGA